MTGVTVTHMGEDPVRMGIRLPPAREPPEAGTEARSRWLCHSPADPPPPTGDLCLQSCDVAQVCGLSPALSVAPPPVPGSV